MSTVDVIVPCYQYGHFLRECVDSVLTQAGVDVRVLIIDDASPDNTAEIAAELAKSDSRVHFLKHLSNQGHIRTYNEGLEWASSDYLLLLSADDYLLPGALLRAVELMDANPEVSFTFGNVLELKPSGEQTPVISVPRKVSRPVVSGVRFIELSGSMNIVRTPTAVVRTQVQRLVGGYRFELTHSGDMEMWLRLAAHGSVGTVNAYQAVYRRHSENMSLEYSREHDLQQRKAAVDSFFEACGYMLPHSKRIRHKIDWLLARDAVSLGSSAFNMCDMKSCQAFCDFARLTCPTIRWSFAWMKIGWKRRIGYEAWRAFEPAVRAADRINSLLRG